MKRLIIPFILATFNSETILHVPQDYETIQIGLDSASDGDTVLVAPGTYDETIVIDHDVNLLSHYILNNDVSVIAGDLNLDNLMNILDVILLVNVVLDTDFSVTGDMNADCEVNILDIVSLVNEILSI